MGKSRGANLANLGVGRAIRLCATGEDPEILASILEILPQYRILRAINPDVGLEELSLPRPDNGIAVILDTETTGLDSNTDKLIEIAIQRVLFDRNGEIIEIERPRSWLEDPGCEISERLTRLTGLDAETVSGKRFDDDTIVGLIGRADMIVAHNASFDRPFIDRRFLDIRSAAWACSLTQIDWLRLGFDGRSLGYLLMQTGRFFEGHRAANDVIALTTLLGSRVSGGRSIFSYLLENFGKRTVLIEAVGAPFESKDMLKSAGYHWNSRRRFWWRELDEENAENESAWLDNNVYFGAGKANMIYVTPRERFSGNY